MATTDRRGFLAAAGLATATLPLLDPALADARRRPQPAPPPIGSGGTVTTVPALAKLAASIGEGECLCFIDLAAFDNNLAIIDGFARQHGWAVRPAVKSFECPGFIQYALRRLREPRALIFHLRQVAEIMRCAPAGTDLMMGYPPSLGELTKFLSQPPARRPHRVRVLVDGPELLQIYADLARRSRRPLPLEVAFQIESGAYLSGFQTSDQLSEGLRILRAARDRLRLTAVLCYDGYGSFNSDRTFRETMVADCCRRWQGWLDQLAAEGGDLYDPRTLVRNGPASSSYQLYAGRPQPNEISPGTAFLMIGYLTQSGYENAGLRQVLAHAGPVNRLPGTAHMPLTGLPLGNQVTVGMKGGAWTTHDGKEDNLAQPTDMRDDSLRGGRGNQASYFLAPPDIGLRRGDYVVLRGNYPNDTLDYFDNVVAIRNGEVKRVWPTFRRWGLAA